MKELKPHKVGWEQIERFLQSAEKKLASGPTKGPVRFFQLAIANLVHSRAVG
jgi:hypothetical protein